MADNYVSIRIKADDTAKPDLDELKAKLDELGAKVDTARVDVDDADAEVKLLRMKAKLAELDAKVANPRIRVAGALRAEAEIAAIDLEMDRLKEKEDTSGSGGLLSRILFGAGGEGGIGGQLFANGPPGEGSLLGMLFGPAGLAIVPAIGAALVEVTGLISGIAAAGAGAGAFAALAYPAFEKVKGAVGDTKAELAKLSPDERSAVEGIRGMTAEFSKMSTAFQPEAFKVFASGLQLVGKLLPDITPFARTFANVISGLLEQAGKFASSKGFSDWLAQFHGLEGPALTAIGDGIGKVTIAFGKLLTTMNGQDVARTIGIAFNVVAGILDGVSSVVKRLMTNWDSMSSTAKRDTHEVAASFDALRSDLAQWAADAGRDVGDVVTFFRQLPGEIMSALSRLGDMMFNAGRNAISRLLDGIKSMVGEVGSVVGSIASKVAGFFGLSPAKEGPLSGGGAPEIRGQHFAADFARGMTSGLGGVASAARQIGAAAGTMPGAGYGTAAAGGGGDIVFRLGSGGSGLDQTFMTWLKGAVRSGGGDPAIFTRKVKFL